MRFVVKCKSRLDNGFFSIAINQTRRAARDFARDRTRVVSARDNARVKISVRTAEKKIRIPGILESFLRRGNEKFHIGDFAERAERDGGDDNPPTEW